MRSRKSIFTVLVLALAVVITSAAFAAPSRGERMAAAGGGFATERIDGNTLSFDLETAGKASLTIKGHRGAAIQRNFAAGQAVSLELVGDAGGALANGRYRYVLRVSTSERPQIKSGTFFVENGVAVSRDAKRGQLSDYRADLNLARVERDNTANKQAGPKEQAIPDDESFFSAYSPWYNNGYFIQPNPRIVFNSYYYGIFAPYTYYSTFVGHYFWDPYGYEGTFNVGNVGRRREIAVRGDFDNYSYNGNLNDWAVNGAVYDYAFGTTFYRYPVYGSGNVAHWAQTYDIGEASLYYQNLVVTPFGVGIGTYYPYADLAIYDYGSYAAMRLNNGTAGWAFSNTPAGVFTVNKLYSGGQEFSVRTRNNGDGVPTMKVQGTVEATQGFINSSSRSVKTDFNTLDGEEVLANLAELPLMSWRYKEDHLAARHAGPTAEDFQAAFQLGDGTTISTVDADGVALAAIQGLHSLLQERDAELNALRSEVADLRRLLESQHPEH